MSGYDYAKSAATALKLITKFGQTAAIIRTEVKEPSNPWDPSTGETVVTEYTVQAVVTEYAQRLIDGVSVKYGDKLVLVASSGLAVTPAPNDSISVGGQTFSVVSVNVVAPGGVPLVYNLQARI